MGVYYIAELPAATKVFQPLNGQKKVGVQAHDLQLVNVQVARQQPWQLGGPRTGPLSSLL
jgi:hypothetical protein